MLNSSKILKVFSYTTIYSNFNFLDPLLFHFELLCLQTHRQAHSYTDTQPSIDALGKPQLEQQGLHVQTSQILNATNSWDMLTAYNQGT